VRGRGTPENPANRYERLFLEPDPEAAADAPPTEYYRDASRTILAENDSPDIPFRWSLNPYRGCEHGCSYCYARPSHEYLGFSAGLDFETRLMVKEDAPELLRRTLSRPRWQPETIALSGNTDAYQPLERRLGITRRCLEVLAEFRNPVDVITKSELVARDADLLAELARHGAARVMVSVTTLDADLAGRLEPRAARPQRRLEAVRTLADAGVPVGVMVAPVIPGLTDEEMPAILEQAAAAGACTAAWILLRLPSPVDALFQDWLARHAPGRKDKVMHRVRECRDGAVTDARFGRRMRGQGPYAGQLAALFGATARRLGLDRQLPAPSTEAFRRPGQLF
jgi:DNA repair photolyase